MGLPTDKEVEDDVSVSSAKELIYEMVAGSTAHSSTGEKDETLALLSNHAVELDKQHTAIRYMRDALQIHMVALGMKHPDTGKCLMNIAKMYRGSGKDRKNESLVLGYFKHTAPILYEVGGMCPRARGSVLNDMAVIHMRRRDFDEAIKFLLDALRSYETDAAERESNVYSAHAMQVWRNLGECYIHQELYNSAEGAFLEALDLQRESRRIQDAADELKLDMIGVDRSVKNLINDTSIADTLCRIGKACAAGGEHQRALEVYSEAMTVINRDAADANRSDRELLAQRDQLTHILFCVAEACTNVGDYDKAMRMYNLSIDIRNSCGAFKKDTRLSTKIHCLRCFLGIGDIYAKIKDFTKAKKQYREASSYLMASGVKETHEIAKTLRQKLDETGKIMDAVSTRCPEIFKLEQQADAEIERGALDQAIATLTQLLTMRRAALKRLKDAGLNTTEQVYAIACLLQTFGFVFAKNGDDENAERAFKDAARLFRKVKPDTSFEV
jgi:tetratricopeptide (TPR) repeat protein